MGLELANQVLDFHDDQSVLKGLIGSQVPASIAKSTVTDHEKLASLGRTAYALCFETESGEEHHRFPIVTAADAWLSQLALEKNAHKLPHTLRDHAQAMISQAFFTHGLSTGKTASANKVDQKVFRLQEMAATERLVKAAQVTEARTATKHFALDDRYPLDTVEQVKEAALYLDRWTDQFPPIVRRAYSVKLAARAAELSIEPEGKKWKKYASAGYGTEVGVQIHIRRQMIPETDAFLEGLKKVSAARENLGPEAFALLLSKFDALTGIEGHYGQDGLEDPYASTFEEKSMRKVASGYRWEDESTGLKMSEKDLEKVSSDKADKLKSYLGESVTKELKKHGSSIFDSLPTDYKIIIAKISTGAI